MLFFKRVKDLNNSKKYFFVTTKNYMKEIFLKTLIFSEIIHYINVKQITPYNMFS